MLKSSQFVIHKKKPKKKDEGEERKENPNLTCSSSLQRTINALIPILLRDAVN